MSAPRPQKLTFEEIAREGRNKAFEALENPTFSVQQKLHWARIYFMQVGAYRHLAEAYQKLNHWYEARVVWDEILTLPHQAHDRYAAFAGIAQFHFHKREYDEGIKWLESGIKAYPAYTAYFRSLLGCETYNQLRNSMDNAKLAQGLNPVQFQLLVRTLENLVCALQDPLARDRDDTFLKVLNFIDSLNLNPRSSLSHQLFISISRQHLFAAIKNLTKKEDVIKYLRLCITPGTVLNERMLESNAELSLTFRHVTLDAITAYLAQHDPLENDKAKLQSQCESLVTALLVRDFSQQAQVDFLNFLNQNADKEVFNSMPRRKLFAAITRLPSMVDEEKYLRMCLDSNTALGKRMLKSESVLTFGIGKFTVGDIEIYLRKHFPVSNAPVPASMKEEKDREELVNRLHPL